MLTAQDITLIRGGARLLDGVDLALAPGQVTALLGANGAGKSSLLGVLSGRLTPTKGRVLLGTRALHQYTVQALARRRAVLAQDTHVSFSFTALEIVCLGLAPYGDRLTRAEQTRRAVAALDRLDALHLAERDFLTLSGGEKQRVQIARVLVQILGDRPLTEDPAGDGARYLLLDEPTSALDLKHQVALMGLLREVAGRGLGVVMVVHDMNLAAGYADRLVLMQAGRILAEGDADAVLRAETLKTAFGVGVAVHRHESLARPLVVPLAS